LLSHILISVSPCKFRCFSPTAARIASIKDKWRLPLILLRLQKGLDLRGKDKAIYARFSAGMSQPELVAAVARVLGTVVTSHQPEDLPRVALSIVIDPYTPFPKPKFHAPSPQTLPRGFVESVLQAEQARRTGRSPRTATSPTVPSTDSTDKRGRRNTFNLSVPGLGITSETPTNTSSEASSLNSSLAGSRASSPRGSREFSPRPSLHRFVLPPLSLGVAFEDDEPRTKPHRGSFGALLPTLLSGRLSPVSSTVEGSIDIYPSVQVQPKAETYRRAGLRERRRTFDTAGDKRPTSAVPSPARIFPSPTGAVSALSAILGLSTGSKRVAPAAWAENEYN
jgi:hypothetical protein